MQSSNRFFHVVGIGGLFAVLSLGKLSRADAPVNIEMSVDLSFPERNEMVLRVVNNETREIECSTQVRVQVEVNAVVLSTINISKVVYLRARGEVKLPIGKQALIDLNLVNPHYTNAQILSDFKNCSYAEVGLLKIFPQQHASWIASMVVSPDNSRVLTGASDSLANLWKTDTGNLVYSFNHKVDQFSRHIEAVAFSRGGMLAATGEGSRLWLWDVTSGKTIGRYPFGEFGNTRTVDFSSDGRSVLMNHPNDLGVLVFDLTSKNFIHALKTSGFVYFGRYLKDNQRIVVGDTNGRIEIWNLATGQMVRRLVQLANATEHVHIAPDEKSVLAADTETGKIIEWDIETGQVKRQIAVPTAKLFNRTYLSHDGTTLVYQERNGAQQIYCLLDLETGNEFHRFIASENATNGVFSREAALSPDGRKMVLGMSDGTVRLIGLPRR